MTARERPALAEPPEPGREARSLASFPVWHVHAGAVFHRVTRADHGPWWFASDGSGRFDLQPPRGTCYLADDPVLAVLEVFGDLRPGRVVGVDALAGRRVWALGLPDQCDAADTTVRGARGFGVTAELSTVTPYDQPRRWASAFLAGGFGGVRYRARHDPGGGRALALFGAAGEQRRWRRGRSSAIDADLLDRLHDEAGVVVAVVPAAADLDATLD